MTQKMRKYVFCGCSKIFTNDYETNDLNLCIHGPFVCIFPILGDDRFDTQLDHIFYFLHFILSFFQVCLYSLCVYCLFFALVFNNFQAQLKMFDFEIEDDFHRFVLFALVFGLLKQSFYFAVLI